MTSDIVKFEQQVTSNIKKLGDRADLQAMGVDFVRRAGEAGYSYNFKWMGVPVIQFPQDLLAMQELIWNIKPDVIIETGVARGGSLVFYSSLLSMIGKPDGKVIGVDIDIRPHNRETIENHPFGKNIHLVSGSSVHPDIIAQVKALCGEGKTVMVCLDSLHTHDHVLEEMRLYSQFVTTGSYLVVFDTVIEELPSDYFPDRPWSPGNNPMTAVFQYLKEDDSFVIDADIPNKILITVARNGYLKKVK